MKKVLIAALCFCNTLSFAQNGFFLQPEIGAGISNTSWEPSSPAMSYPGQNSVFSFQDQVDIGYNAGKWQFITGIGYLRTGVKLQNGTINDFIKNGFVPADASSSIPYSYGPTDLNAHLIIPVKIGYGVHHFSNKLSFIPIIGAEIIYNLPRTFIYPLINKKVMESLQNFNNNCNQLGVMGLLQLNFEYRLNNHCDLTAGPSVQYMYTSELNFKDEHDYAVLMNLGLKWNFKSRKQIN